jgi:hypothetical protein
MMTSPLIIEWQTLQNNYEQHEKNALLIKLTCLTIFLLSQAMGSPLLWATFIVLLCWGLESIFKTYQSRLGERLLNIEATIQQGHEKDGMQLHTHWQNKRPNGARLIIEYAEHALKPTVAYPYALIFLVNIGISLIVMF